MIDYTKLSRKLNPNPGAEDVIRLRVGVVTAISSSGLVEVSMGGGIVSGVSALSGAVFAVGTVVQILSYRGSLMILGASGQLSGQPVEATGNITLGTTSSTSYVNSLTTTGVHGVAFVAPASGKAEFQGRSAGGSSSVGQYAQLDYEVRTGGTVGSGSVHRATSDNTAAVFLSSTAAGQGPLSITGLIQGLTPGGTYNACLTYASSSGGSSASFNRRYVAVYPR